MGPDYTKFMSKIPAYSARVEKRLWRVCLDGKVGRGFPDYLGRRQTGRRCGGESGKAESDGWYRSTLVPTLRLLESAQLNRERRSFHSRSTTVTKSGRLAWHRTFRSDWRNSSFPSCTNSLGEKMENAFVRLRPACVRPGRLNRDNGTHCSGCPLLQKCGLLSGNASKRAHSKHERSS